MGDGNAVAHLLRQLGLGAYPKKRTSGIPMLVLVPMHRDASATFFVLLVPMHRDASATFFGLLVPMHRDASATFFGLRFSDSQTPSQIDYAD